MAKQRKPVIHELKIWPEYYQSVANGEKTFEVRRADRDYKVGDYLRLREWDPATEEYTGREQDRFLSYILRDSEYVKLGYCVLALMEP